MRWAASLIVGCFSCYSACASPRTEQVIAVPGYADFLAVDDDAVWVTNEGRVEKWSLNGKLATVTTPRPCGAMAVAAKSLWVADCKDKTLLRIDLATATRIASIPTGIASDDGEMNVVAGDGSIWVASEARGRIARVDPATNRVVASIRVRPNSNYLAFGSGALWAVSAARRVLQKIDPATNSVVRRTKLGHRPGFLAVGESAVWVQEQGDGTVAKIDPASGAVAGRVKVDAKLNYGDIDTGGGKIWLRTTLGQTYVVIDPVRLAIVERVGTEAGSGALRYTAFGVWTSAHDLHTLSWWPHSTVGEAALHDARP